MSQAGSGAWVEPREPRTYRRTFTAADLAAGILTLQHDLGTTAIVCSVYNAGGLGIAIDALITVVDANTCNVNLAAFVVGGTWEAAVIGAA